MTVVHARGARIPALGLGTWELQGSTCAARVADALALGYRHVDTAQVYGNHAAVGKGLRRSRVPRDRYFLTSKLWLDSLRRPQVIASTERSLRELGTEYLDLLLVHWPGPQVPLTETLDAMLELRDRGRVRHLGVSNFPPALVAEAAAHAPVVCDQVEYHPYLPQRDLLRGLWQRGMALVAYCPLGRGRAARDPVLRDIGRRHGKTAAQVALRWLVQQERVAAIPKASSRRHLEENLAVFDFELRPEEMHRIHALGGGRGRRMIDPEFAPAWEAGA